MNFNNFLKTTMKAEAKIKLNFSLAKFLALLFLLVSFPAMSDIVYRNAAEVRKAAMQWVVMLYRCYRKFVLVLSPQLLHDNEA